MAKLFLLKPDFSDKNMDDKARYYCPYCAMILGVLNYYPRLKDELDISFIDFERPRKQIVDLIGEDNQGCPNLILNKEDVAELGDISYLKPYGAYYFVNSAPLIARYFSEKYHIGKAH
ncbi:DUF3088 family protein [Aestuariivivens sediminis]|uniref:DUF3088 family protein n=1 Tax=Aestuariivivens sediminis TaxID=2913557 RepID=UPI001F5AD8FE|nr:DUF3088 family protein [Aestuariivivens sediminis]